MLELDWDDIAIMAGEQPEENPLLKNLEELWENTSHDPILFIPRAYNIGAGVKTIQKFLKQHGKNWSIEKIYKLLDY